MNAQEYIKQQLASGALTLAHIETMVRDFQDTYNVRGGVDGKPGSATLAAIEKCDFYPKPEPEKPQSPGRFLERLPLPAIRGAAGFRKPKVTSGFRPADRKDHDGLDLFYRWEVGDQPAFTGDGGCEGKNADGTPKWVVPYGTDALAAAGGTVQLAGPSPTGYRCWVNHGNGLRTGYFHMEKLYVHAGQYVQAGAALGLVGHNPSPAVDGRHLHFELSPVEKYEPMDPTPYFKEGLL